ncbi:hypothetical protein N9164_13580 [Draconibacterium sp.]|jgi:hypothetical protein|nr:hypothetical protein [Draconibacterium sp.]
MQKHRKLEYFEDQLKVTPFGREVLKVVRAHMDEVMYLINKNRPTMVCWQRHHGPKFIRSVVNSGFEEDAEFVKEVDGITMEEIMLNMAEVLQDNGSQELKSTIGKYARLVLRMARETSSLREVIHRINNKEILQQHE